MGNKFQIGARSFRLQGLFPFFVQREGVIGARRQKAGQGKKHGDRGQPGQYQEVQAIRKRTSSSGPHGQGSG